MDHGVPHLDDVVAAAEAAATPWWADHQNLAAVARALVEEGADTEEILDFLDKPWHWEDTFTKVRAMRDAVAAAIEDAREAEAMRVNRIIEGSV